MPSLEEILGTEESEKVRNTFSNDLVIIEDREEKDRYSRYKEILENNPDLKEGIIEIFSNLQSVPVIHITSKAFSKDGEIINSDFLENIFKNGFKEKDTNVGVFMKKSGKRETADPVFIKQHPERFLSELDSTLSHYYHHGIRTNKNILGNNFNEYKGVPVVVIIDASNVPLIPGSDHEDHYLLGESVNANKIIGIIDLLGVYIKDNEGLVKVAGEYLELVRKYIKEEN